jgi:hypothetical protein
MSRSLCCDRRASHYFFFNSPPSRHASFISSRCRPNFIDHVVIRRHKAWNSKYRAHLRSVISAHMISVISVISFISSLSALNSALNSIISFSLFSSRSCSRPCPRSWSFFVDSHRFLLFSFTKLHPHTSLAQHPLRSRGSFHSDHVNRVNCEAVSTVLKLREQFLSS